MLTMSLKFALLVIETYFRVLTKAHRPSFRLARSTSRSRRKRMTSVLPQATSAASSMEA
jgi:hypothetical protein